MKRRIETPRARARDRAAWLLDLCGHLQHALLHAYGDELEAYWTATAPEQPIVAPPATRRRPPR